MKMKKSHGFRIGLTCGVIALLVACDGLLDVENPSMVTPETISGEDAPINALVSGIEGEFRVAFSSAARDGASATDEGIFSHSWDPWNVYDERRVTPENSMNRSNYGAMQRARATGVEFIERLRTALGPAASTHSSFARALAYAGFSHLLIAGYYCEVPVDGEWKKPEAVYQSAIDYLQEAAQVAAASGTKRYENLANVGLARAHLELGNLSSAVEAAQKVDEGFAEWARFATSNNSSIYNPFYRTAGLMLPSEFNFGIAPEDRDQFNDRRTPLARDTVLRLMEGRAPRYAYMPSAPSSFSEHNPDDPQTIGADSDIRFASGLEARYVIAEASLNDTGGAWTSEQVRDFIDERRMAGGQDPFAGSDLFAELRDQRKLDFYLAGYRLPDLIRYERNYGIQSEELWPTGEMKGFSTSVNLNYGSSTCWPVGSNETVSP